MAAAPAAKWRGDLDSYSNCGTAGRYEDLIWCIEIDHGTASLHACHHDDDGELVRETMKLNPRGELVA